MKLLIIALLLLTATSANAGTYNPERKVGKAPTEKVSAKEAKPEIYKQAKDLEAVLISVMVEPMFPKGKESGLYGGGPGSDIYRSMMIQQYGKILGNGTNLGVADNITKSLTR